MLGGAIPNRTGDLSRAVGAVNSLTDSRTEMVSPIKDRRAKRKQDLDNVKVFEKNDAKNQDMMAMCEDVIQQSKKDNEPQKTVFKLIQKLCQTNDVAKTFEDDVSNLREKKNLLRAQIISNPETLSEINEIDKEIEYKQTVLKTIKVGLLSRMKS